MHRDFFLFFPPSAPPRPLWALTSRVLLLVAIATPFPKPSVLSSGQFHNGTGSIAAQCQAVRGDSASHSSSLFFKPPLLFLFLWGWSVLVPYLPFFFPFLFYSIPFFSLTPRFLGAPSDFTLGFSWQSPVHH